MTKTLLALLVVAMPLFAHADLDSNEPRPGAFDPKVAQNKAHVSDRYYIKELIADGYSLEEATKIAHTRFHAKPKTTGESLYTRFLIGYGYSPSAAAQSAHDRYGNMSESESVRAFLADDLKRERIYLNSNLEMTEDARHKLKQNIARMQAQLDAMDASSGRVNRAAVK